MGFIGSVCREDEPIQPGLPASVMTQPPLSSLYAALSAWMKPTARAPVMLVVADADADAHLHRLVVTTRGLHGPGGSRR